MISFVYTEDKFSYYIFWKAEGKNWEECFVIIPLINDPEKCLVYYFSNFKPGMNFINEQPVSPFVDTFLQDQRMLFLRDLRVFVNKQPVELEFNWKSGVSTPMKKTT